MVAFSLRVSVSGPSLQPIRCAHVCYCGVSPPYHRQVGFGHSSFPITSTPPSSTLPHDLSKHQRQLPGIDLLVDFPCLNPFPSVTQSSSTSTRSSLYPPLFPSCLLPILCCGLSRPGPFVQDIRRGVERPGERRQRPWGEGAQLHEPRRILTLIGGGDYR